MHRFFEDASDRFTSDGGAGVARVTGAEVTVKPTIYILPVSGGYEVRQEGVEGVTPLANKESALWLATALCLPAGGTVKVQNSRGVTIKTQRIPKAISN